MILREVSLTGVAGHEPDGGTVVPCGFGRPNLDIRKAPGRRTLVP